MNDFIIVGRGLAASVLMHRLHQHGIRFKVIGDKNLSTCSRVAGGIWNPIVFKRMSKSWLADELVPCLLDFYAGCEKLLDAKLLYRRNIVKPFMEAQEKTLWLNRAKNEMADFLDTAIQQEKQEDLKGCNIPGEYGMVGRSGNIDTVAFLDGTASFFGKHIIDDVFDHGLLEITKDAVRYKSTEAHNIIFCEGHLVKNNPFFNWIPLKPAKGEIALVTAKELQLNHSIFNRDGFIFKAGDGTFKAGATYAWDDLEQEPTAKGRQELEQKLNKLLSCTYSITQHQAGIRPASIDRRPVIGPHPKHSNLFVFNGLGTKGVMLAPYFSEKFVHFYLQKTELNPEVNVKRFYSSYESHKK